MKERGYKIQDFFFFKKNPNQNPAASRTTALKFEQSLKIGNRIPKKLIEIAAANKQSKIKKNKIKRTLK